MSYKHIHTLHRNIYYICVFLLILLLVETPSNSIILSINIAYASDKNTACSCGGACAGSCTKIQPKKETSSSDEEYTEKRTRKKKKKKRKEFRRRYKENRKQTATVRVGREQSSAKSDLEKKHKQEREEHEKRKEQRQNSGVKTPSDSENTDEQKKRHTLETQSLLGFFLERHRHAKKKEKGESTSSNPTPICSSHVSSSSDGGSEEERCKQKQHQEKKDWAEQHKKRTEKAVSSDDDSDDGKLKQKLEALNLQKVEELSSMGRKHKKERRKARKKDRKRRHEKEGGKSSSPESSSDGGSEEERCKQKQIQERKLWVDQNKRRSFKKKLGKLLEQKSPVGQTNTSKTSTVDSDEEKREEALEKQKELSSMDARHRSERKEARKKDRRKREEKEEEEVLSFLMACIQGSSGASDEDSEEEGTVQTFTLHYEEDGEPPDNNQSIPPWLQQANTSNINEDEPHQQLVNKKMRYKFRALLQHTLFTNSSPEYISCKESLLSLQQALDDPTKDAFSSLRMLENRMYAARLTTNQHFQIFAAAQDGTQRAFSSHFGIILDTITPLRFGTSYTFTKHDKTTLIPSPPHICTQKTFLGYTDSKAKTHLLSCSIAWNTNNPGITCLIEGLWGTGTSVNIRHCLFEDNVYSTKGTPSIKTKGFSLRLGYALGFIPQTLITPYVELIKTYSIMDAYQENTGVTAAKITSNTGRSTEKILGLNLTTSAIDRLQLSIWINGIHTQRKTNSLSCVPLTPYINSIKVPNTKKTYTQGELGFSMDVNITESFGIGMSMFIRNKVHSSIEKDAVSMHIWYNF